MFAIVNDKTFKWYTFERLQQFAASGTPLNLNVKCQFVIFHKNETFILNNSTPAEWFCETIEISSLNEEWHF